MPVEVSHPVVDFLRRLDEKGVIASQFWSTRPIDGRDVAAALEQARQRSRQLSAWDRRVLERYLDEFDEERKQNNTHLTHSAPPLELHGKVEYYSLGYIGDSVPDYQAFGFGSAGPTLNATYKDFVYFTVSGAVGMERNVNRIYRNDYNPMRGLPVGTARLGWRDSRRGVTTFDGYRAVLGFGDRQFSVDMGQDWNQWGPGRWQNPTISARPHFWVADSLASSKAFGRTNSVTGYTAPDTNAPNGFRRGYRYPGESAPMPQIRLRARGEHWEYVKIVAERKGVHRDSGASLIAHRLQLRFGQFTLGATEMLSIGTREVSPVLILPGIPLKVAEHDGGDRDNAAMSADLEYAIRGHGRVYGEFFFDDYSGPPLDFWGNKFAWLIGGSWQDPFGIPTEIHMEYAHVDPWVYSHRLYNTAMQHYGALIGSALPPNSRALFASATFPFLLKTEGHVEYGFRQRDLRSAGSSIFDDLPRSEAQRTKQFLEIDVETRHVATATVKWNWKRYTQVSTSLGGLWVTNWMGKAGENLATPTASMEILFKY
jgi:hypothetical protein